MSDEALAAKTIFGRLRNNAALLLLKRWDRGGIYTHIDGELAYDHVSQSILPPSMIADPTGAGDVFAAGVLASEMSVRGAHAGAVHLGLAAARTKLQGVAQAGYDRLPDVLHPHIESGHGEIFVSHAEADSDLARDIVTLLERVGVSAERIFCSSLPDTGVPIGAEVIAELHARLTNASLVICLATESYLESSWCRYEVGAAWALEKRTFTLVGRKVVDSLDAMMKGHQYGKHDAASLDSLYDQLVDRSSRHLTTNTWERIRDEYLERVARIA